jgi:hypothetical protein
MSHHPIRALIAAAVALADTLSRENAALVALNLPAALVLLAEKQAATEAFTAAHARAAAALAKTPGLPAADQELAETVGARLRELAAENKRLLERALRVQGRVMGSIARALPRALATAPRYDAVGGIAGANRPPPVALSARA